MMKTEPANRDVERLKPHLKMAFESSRVRRREAVIKLINPDPEFQEGTSKALFYFLIASIAAAHRGTPADRAMTARGVNRRRAATRKIAAACRLWEQDDPPDDLFRALLISIWHEIVAERDLAKIKTLNRGRPPYRAFNKFIRTLAQQYKRATGQSAIIKLNNSRDQRYSGPFADLLEEIYSQANEIWKSSGFEMRLATPTSKEAQLDYARKALQQTQTIAAKS